MVGASLQRYFNYCAEKDEFVFRVLVPKLQCDKGSRDRSEGDDV